VDVSLVDAAPSTGSKLDCPFTQPLPAVSHGFLLTAADALRTDRPACSPVQMAGTVSKTR